MSFLVLGVLGGPPIMHRKLSGLLRRPTRNSRRLPYKSQLSFVSQELILNYSLTWSRVKISFEQSPLNHLFCITYKVHRNIRGESEPSFFSLGLTERIGIPKTMSGIVLDSDHLFFGPLLQVPHRMQRNSMAPQET